MAPWETKAHRLIAAMAMTAHHAANQKPDGTWRKKHVPYRLPADAETLVTCLGMTDRRAAEETAKALMLRRTMFRTADGASLD